MMLFVVVICLVAAASLWAFTDRYQGRRCAISVMAVHGIALVAGLSNMDWFLLLGLNASAMMVTMWRPAGQLNITIGGLFVAASAQHLAFGLSVQGPNALHVSWLFGLSLAAAQALAMLTHMGGRLAAHYRHRHRLGRPRLVHRQGTADQR